ncbi:hypothetical protein P43SY_007429 [Pythium insidiosum]|uniref:Transmembrane protein n=1 Tax=Pythium insidiosum TaxID=114742 RepID=A0AAD5Q6T3_PYTIN|nr:hypothetical protein P43SY_007429 [Pythium insidiosum]
MLTAKWLVVLNATSSPPPIDGAKLLKTQLFARRCPRLLRLLDALASPQWSRVLRVLYVLGACLAIPVPLFPAAVGRWAAILGQPLMLPSTLVLLCHLRHDVVALLLQTFEFWFALVTAVLSFAVYVAYVGDARGISVVSALLGLLFALLADSSVQSPRFVVLTFAGVASLFLLNVVVLGLGRMDGAQPFEIWRDRDRAVSATSMLTQGFFVVAITQLRHAYTRRSVLRGHARVASASAGASAVQLFASRCVLLSTPLRWMHAHRRVSARLSLTRRPAQKAAEVSRITLRAPGYRGVLDARRVLWGRVATARRAPLLRGLVALCWLSCVGAFVAGTVQSVVPRSSSLGEHARAMAAPLGLLSCSSALLLNAVYLVGVFQPDVLHLLYSSFDVLFVMAHLLAVHLCLGAMCRWDERTALIAASLLALHWVLLVDAVPPTAFSRLPAPSRRWAALLLSTFLVALLVVVLDLLVWDKLYRFENPVVMRIPATQPAIEGRAVSFLLSRLPTIVAWLVRILWRFLQRDTHELVMLRGPVEYEDLELHQRVRNTLNSQQQLLRSLQSMYSVRFGSFSAFASAFSQQQQQTQLQRPSIMRFLAPRRSVATPCQTPIDTAREAWKE